MFFLNQMSKTMKPAFFHLATKQQKYLSFSPVVGQSLLLKQLANGLCSYLLSILFSETLQGFHLDLCRSFFLFFVNPNNLTATSLTFFNLLK